MIGSEKVKNMEHSELTISGRANSRMVSGIIADPHAPASTQVAGKDYEYVLGTKDPTYIVPSSMISEQFLQAPVRTLPATSVSIAFG